MSTSSIVNQIAENLASARCEQDLDLVLSSTSESDWQLFVDYMISLVKELEKTEPERAQAMRYLMHSYLEGWHRKKRRESLSS